MSSFQPSSQVSATVALDRLKVLKSHPVWCCRRSKRSNYLRNIQFLEASAVHRLRLSQLGNWCWLIGLRGQVFESGEFHFVRHLACSYTPWGSLSGAKKWIENLQAVTYLALWYRGIIVQSEDLEEVHIDNKMDKSVDTSPYNSSKGSGNAKAWSDFAKYLTRCFSTSIGPTVTTL